MTSERVGTVLISLDQFFFPKQSRSSIVESRTPTTCFFSLISKQKCIHRRPAYLTKEGLGGGMGFERMEECGKKRLLRTRRRRRERLEMCVITILTFHYCSIILGRSRASRVEFTLPY